MIIFRESHFHFNFFADLSADKLLLESRNKGAGADRQRIFLAFAAFKRFAVNESLEIKSNLIFILNSSVRNLNRTCIALTLFIDLLVYFLLCYSRGNLFHLQAFIFAQSHFRLHCNFCCEDERLALLQLDNLNLRLRYDLELTLIVCFSVRL